ncbi:hypothetical protein K493DRAFT_310042 [Basidiobolus meristosporus CBS 931.73]|uniref:Uncharacterized protein n=1 Tax=Basidiobolus meristosporus CBS 931.73 TaxID=1314790 RepID=A0A1Y1ZC41_9FUNG|nr:hypothetical protein K493DRAFT_310042 [Basidiobolus meristosporus CBS 931.73]|eukprot:ORY07828.1 hypothetical protein K493DRAFT_310042 [Basidiobolus meristosporus CBS 931.73]
MMDQFYTQLQKHSLTPGLLPRQRRFLKQIETTIQKISPNFTMPYWVSRDVLFASSGPSNQPVIFRTGLWI